MDAKEKERHIRETAGKGLSSVVFSRHALKRALQRDIDLGRAVKALTEAELIEDYQQRQLNLDPDCLVLCWEEGKPLHAVIAIRPDGKLLIATVYWPRPEEWSDDFRKRL